MAEHNVTIMEQHKRKGQKLSKAQRKAESVSRALSNRLLEEGKKEPEATKPEEAVAVTPAIADGEVAEANAAEKPKRKASDTVTKWRATKAFPDPAVITIKPEHKAKNPKRGKAAVRFDWYKDGMTVAEYKEVAKKHASPIALATADIRWDYAAGFITVE